MLKVANLNVSIGPVPIIRDASLAVNEGEMCGLIGRNGAGKTTLLRALMGAIPATGKAELGHVDLLALPAHRRVGARHRLHAGGSPAGAGIHRRGEHPAADLVDASRRRRAAAGMDLLPHAGGGALPQRRALELSGGQQKMVALARALMAGTRILAARRAVRGPRAGAGAPAGRGAGQSQERRRVGADCRIERGPCRRPFGARLFHRARRRRRQAIARRTRRYGCSIHTGSFRGGEPARLLSRRTGRIRPISRNICLYRNLIRR